MKKTNNDVIRAALMPRVSTDEQVRRGYSLQAQEDSLVEFAKQNNMKIVGIYRDEGHSARKPVLKRPMMLKLLEDVKAGKIDQILFIKLDRWFRNVREYHEIQKILDQHNVTWRAILEDYNTATADGRLKVNIMLSVAENEADRTSERIKFVNDAKIARKEAICSKRTAPFGYTVEKIDGVKRLVFDTELEPMIRYFFSMLETYSIRLAGTMTNEKFGVRRPYSKWYKIAKEEIYTGTYRGVEEYCPAYITKEQFKRFSAPDESMVRKTQENRVYIFTGVIFCPCCSRRLTGKYVLGGNNEEYMYYRCHGALTRACDNRLSISEKSIEEQLLERLRDDLEELVISADVEAVAPAKKKPSQLGKLNEQLRRLNVAYFAGNMSDDEYKKDADDLKQKIAKAMIEDQEEEKPADLTAIKELLSTDFESIYTTLTASEKQLFWRSIIERITFDGKTLQAPKYRQ